MIIKNTTISLAVNKTLWREERQSILADFERNKGELIKSVHIGLILHVDSSAVGSWVGGQQSFHEQVALEHTMQIVSITFSAQDATRVLSNALQALSAIQKGFLDKNNWIIIKVIHKENSLEYKNTL